LQADLAQRRIGDLQRDPGELPECGGERQEIAPRCLGRKQRGEIIVVGEIARRADDLRGLKRLCLAIRHRSGPKPAAFTRRR